MKTIIIFLLIFSLIVWLAKLQLIRLISWFLNWENYRRIWRMHLALINMNLIADSRNEREEKEHLKIIQESVSALQRVAAHPPDNHKCNCSCLLVQLSVLRKAVAIGRTIRN